MSLPLRLLPLGSAPDPIAAALTAQAAITVAREAAVDTVLARHAEACRASRDLPAAERRAVRRAPLAARPAAIDRAHAARTVADLERDSLALLAGFQAELEKRAASAPPASRSAAALLADLAATLAAAPEPRA